MLLMGLRFVSGLGIGAAVTVAFTMVSSVTLLPALLGFAQERVEVTRWRGLIMAGFAALAILGVGIGFLPLTVVGGVLMILTLLVSFRGQTAPQRSPTAPGEAAARDRCVPVESDHPAPAVGCGSASA